MAVVSIIFGMAVVSGCGNDNQNSTANGSTSAQGKELKYRVMPTASSDLFEAGIKPILEKKGYKLKAVKITDSIQREMALEEGAIDFHVDANQSYLQNFNKQKGTHLIGVLEIPTAPMGIYGGSRKTLDEVQDGDTIAIPNDATNISCIFFSSWVIGPPLMYFIMIGAEIAIKIRQLHSKNPRHQVDQIDYPLVV